VAHLGRLFMKIFWILLFIALNVMLAFAQLQKPTLKITGSIKEIAMQESYPNTKSAFYITYIKLNLKLTNEGSVPVIFLQDTPVIISADILQRENGNDIFLAGNPNSRSSYFMEAKDWTKLKSSLDKPTPPISSTRTVNPKETLEFEGFVRLNIPKFDDYTQDFYRKTATLNFIQKHSPAQINFRCATWSTLTLVINGRTKEKKKSEFAEKLRNRWKNFGYLWTEDIEAQPLSTDFNSVIFKTLID
jgi:hypothetical protein